MESSEQTRKNFSFGFSKLKSSRTLIKTVLTDDVKEHIEEKDYVTSLEDKTVKSLKPVEETKPLIIPLIQKNKWRVPKPEDLEKPDSQPNVIKRSNEIKLPSTGDQITDRAIEEILSEARKEQEQWDARGDTDPNRKIPLLMRNKIPEGYETDDKLDVSLRPDEAAEADYDQVPIEQYGLAMLRGMGFKEDEGIGKNKKLVAPVEAVARPKGLGLGADRSLTLQQKNDTKPTGKLSEREQLVMKKGAYCSVKSGRHHGLYAVVEGIDEDNARVVIRLALGGNVVTLNQMAVELVTKKEYEKYSKYLNKTKVDEYKAEQEKKVQSEANDYETDSSESHTDSKRHKHKKGKHKSSGHERHHKSRKHRSSCEKDSDSYADGRHSDRDQVKRASGDGHHKHDRVRSRSPLKQKKTARHKEIRDSLWLHPFLRVRMIDSHFKKGKYYKSKLIIEDVASLDSCLCKTEDGKILEGLSQSQLETVIPKTEGALVMVVSGAHRGQVAEILDWNKLNNTASVQLLPDKDEILTLDYDTICEYTGNLHNI